MHKIQYQNDIVGEVHEDTFLYLNYTRNRLMSRVVQYPCICSMWSGKKLTWRLLTVNSDKIARNHQEGLRGLKTKKVGRPKVDLINNNHKHILDFGLCLGLNLVKSTESH